MPARPAVLLMLLLQCTACTTVRSPLSDALPRPMRDRYTLTQHQAVSATGCRYHYRVFQPDAPRTRTHVLLGHGFLRGQGTLLALSRALANNGIPAVTMDFCNMRPWRGNHAMNAADMRQLAETLAIADNLIPGGFSAGALAALLAADERSRAVLTLDLVDQDNAGLAAVHDLAIPLVGLHGPAHACNADNRALKVYDTHRRRHPDQPSSLRQIPGASHCEFESPSNALCEALCGDEDDRKDDEATRRLIIDTTLQLLIPYLDHHPVSDGGSWQIDR